ncbi:putative Zn-dependent peptidase [Natranaerovirga pectinivora]|uniref:Putative Zn-dependent peptidase n=1 Tax=Natranaerovirga pectinivora TaxID=682400 RepID=A0A4R3MLR8_9FIRM|nr:pitrilysin family protein [Natranaerovirga pectinivora]TCT15044.1 putative Zn-dependent peptidase [Natranaerovirga pectinivora]
MINTNTLDNGIKVVLEKMDSVRSVAVGVWVRTGSVFEDLENNGISHFIEHMLFKGTKNRTAKQIAEDMSAIGGHLNAFTAKEYTCYYAQTLDEHIEIAMEILGDMLQNSLFADEDIEKEHTVILDEIDMYEDSPEDIAHDLFQQNVWQGQSLGYNILGTKENIKKIKRDELLKYFNENYYGQNIVISVAGNFEETKIMNALNEIFKDIPSDIENEMVYNPEYNKSFIYKDKDIEQAHLCLGFPGIDYLSKDLYTLAILNTVLGGGMNSRLFQSIREEKGLAYSIYSYTSTYKYTGLLYIYAASNPIYVEEVFVQIKEEIKKLRENLITEEELNKIKEQLKSNYIIGLESTNSKMSSNGKSIILLGRVKTQDEIIEKLNSVTLDDFKVLTDKILQYDKLSLSLVGRINNLDIGRIKELWEKE